MTVVILKVMFTSNSYTGLNFFQDKECFLCTFRQEEVLLSEEGTGNRELITIFALNHVFGRIEGTATYSSMKNDHVMPVIIDRTMVTYIKN